MIYLRFAFAVVQFLVIWLFFLPLTVLGFFLVPLAILFRRSEVSPITGALIVNAPSWLWLWGNDQEGLLPEWYRIYRPTWPWWFRAWEWAAWRNSANNLRFVRPWNPPLVPENVEKLDSEWLTVMWDGWRHRAIVYTDKAVFLFGWKLDVTYWPDEATDWRKYGVGFGFRRK